MECWLVREKPVMVIVAERLEKTTRRPKTADRRSPRLPRANWRPQLLEAQARSPASAARRRNSQIQQESAPLRPAMFALPEWQLDRLALAFFSPTRR